MMCLFFNSCSKIVVRIKILVFLFDLILTSNLKYVFFFSTIGTGKSSWTRNGESLSWKDGVLLWEGTGELSTVVS